MDKQAIEEIKNLNPLSSIIGRDIKVIKNGKYYKSLCPFHADKTPSMHIDDEKQYYYCHSCQASGDVIGYIEKTRNVDFKRAVEILGGTAKADFIKRDHEKREAEPEYIPVFPVPEEGVQTFEEALASSEKRTPYIYRPNWSGDPEKIFHSYKATYVCAYKTLAGAVLGYHFRIVLTNKPKKKNGKFEKLPLTALWCKRPDGSEGWTIKGFSEPRPLYGLDNLIDGTGQIFLTEGEPKADAVRQLIGVRCVSWGGTGAVHKVDFAPLRGERVVIWPDNDLPGINAAHEVADKLLLLGCDVKIIYPPAGTPDKWDAADALEEGWQKEKVVLWCKENALEYDPLVVARAAAANQNVEEESGAVMDSGTTEKAPEKPAKKAKEKKPKEKKKDFSWNKERASILENDFFRMLGYNGEIYYYQSTRHQQIIELSLAKHTKTHFFHLAPLSWWELEFPSERGIKWDNVASELIDLNSRRGIFLPEAKKRGRGTWLDNGKVITHMGDKVLMEGKEYRPMDVPSKKIYEASQPIDLASEKALTNAEAYKLISFCERLSWQNPLSGKLLAGWCVIAPICGVLEWRPHIWITGPSNSGKSTIIKKIIGKMLEFFKLQIEGNTSEPGIRSMLKGDAMPVIFDEMEAEDKNSIATVKTILRLARISSSSGVIIKSTSDMKAVVREIQSIFCFSSINPVVNEYADETRITKLVTKQNLVAGGDKLFKLLELDMADTLKPEFVSGMFMRTIKFMPVLLDNIKTFTLAALDTLTEKRYADQIAPMLAGAYLCHSDKRISLEEAQKWIAGHDWGEHTAQGISKDDDRLLEALLSHRLRFTSEGKMYEETIGNMILGIPYSQQSGIYQKELRSRGIKVEGGKFFISTNARPIAMILADTPWSSAWAQALRAIPGAELTGTHHFSGGLRKSRAISIPVDVIRDPAEVREPLADEIKLQEVWDAIEA